MKKYVDADEAFIYTLQDVMDEGAVRTTRGMKSKDARCVTFELGDPRKRLVQHPVRNVKSHYAAANVCWNIAQRDDVEGICFWNEEGRRISDDGKTFYGANYGQRWARHLEAAMELLKLDSGTRRAWVPIWRQTDLVSGLELGYSKDGKDVPCTIGFNLMFDGVFLEMETVMRSQSVWGVFPYDVFLFTVLQELIANELGAELGCYRHVMLSAHVYEREYEKVDEAFDQPFFSSEEMESIPYGYTEACVMLPDVLDDLMNGDAVGEWEQDPLVKLMLPYAREKVPA